MTHMGQPMLPVPVVLSIWFAVGVCSNVARGSLFATEVRLVGGSETVPNVGRVEVWDPTFAEWLSVCDTEWDVRNSQVVCRALGYDPWTARVKLGDDYSDGPFNRSIKGYQCYGTESSLSRCQVKTVDSCSSGKAAWVIFCSAPGYVGCFRHYKYGSDIFNNDTTSPSMTVEFCLRETPARPKPYYVGLKNGNECWCDLENVNFVTNRRRLDSDCNEPCSGNPDQICGQNDRFSIYDATMSYCHDPGNITNGSREVRHAANAFYFGTIVNFTCTVGFQLEGASFIQCVVDRESRGVGWSSEVPKCMNEQVTTDKTSMTTDTVGPGTTTKVEPDEQIIPQANTGLSLGVGAAVALGILSLAALFAIFFRKILRRKGSKPPTSVETNQESTEVTKNRYEERPNYLGNAAAVMEMRHTADIYAEPDRHPDTGPDDVNMARSDDAGWIDNSLYATSEPTSPVYVEVDQ